MLCFLLILTAVLAIASHRIISWENREIFEGLKVGKTTCSAQYYQFFSFYFFEAKIVKTINSQTHGEVSIPKRNARKAMPTINHTIPAANPPISFCSVSEVSGLGFIFLAAKNITNIAINIKISLSILQNFSYQF
jgi:hypothetical protein